MVTLTPSVRVPAALSFSFLLPYDNGRLISLFFLDQADEAFLSPGSPADGSLPIIYSILGNAFCL